MRIEQAVLLGLALVIGGAVAAVTLVTIVNGTTGSAAPSEASCGPIRSRPSN